MTAAVRCQWFALCDRTADGTMLDHDRQPRPCCQRCADRVGGVLDPFPSTGFRRRVGERHAEDDPGFGRRVGERHAEDVS